MENQSVPEEEFKNRIDLSQLQEMVALVREEVRKLVVGQTEMVDLLVAAILSEGHVLIEGYPGVAKTLTAKVFAKIFQAGFGRIQFTPDLMPSDVIGTNIFNPKTSDFDFKKGPIFSNIILIDEINRSPAKTQAALFEVMEEKQITIDGTTYAMEDPFMVLATQNPIEQEGTYRLPEAQLDRFIFKIEVGYPEIEDEVTILENMHNRKSNNDLSAINSILTPEKCTELRQTVRQINVDRSIFSYIAAIMGKTRNSPMLFLGASPRASVAILTASKAFAAMHGRDFVTPEDVQEIAIPVLNHRVILTPEQEMEGATPKQVLTYLIEQVEVPR